MTADDFRRIALSMKDAVEGEHMNHPDFRLGGKIFATIYPGEEYGVVKLTREQQEQFMSARPPTFTPAKGAWGRQGYTMVKLAAADQRMVRDAVKTAWQNMAVKRTASRSKTKKAAGKASKSRKR